LCLVRFRDKKLSVLCFVRRFLNSTELWL
jgi:hypothetical protein